MDAPVFFDVEFGNANDVENTTLLKNCVFMKRDGTYITSLDELTKLFRFRIRTDRYDVLMVICRDPILHNVPRTYLFNSYPEFNPNYRRHNPPNPPIRTERVYRINHLKVRPNDDFTAYLSPPQGERAAFDAATLAALDVSSWATYQASLIGPGRMTNPPPLTDASLFMTKSDSPPASPPPPTGLDILRMHSTRQAAAATATQTKGVAFEVHNFMKSIDVPSIVGYFEHYSLSHATNPKTVSQVQVSGSSIFLPLFTFVDKSDLFKANEKKTIKKNLETIFRLLEGYYGYRSSLYKSCV